MDSSSTIVNRTVSSLFLVDLIVAMIKMLTDLNSTAISQILATSHVLRNSSCRRAVRHFKLSVHQAGQVRRRRRIIGRLKRAEAKDFEGSETKVKATETVSHGSKATGRRLLPIRRR